MKTKSREAESQLPNRRDLPRPRLGPSWPPTIASASECVSSRAHCSCYLAHRSSQGVTISRPIIYGNTAVVLSQKERETLPSPDHTHRWTVAVRSAASAPDSDVVGGADDLSYFIKRVTFKLHDTYTNPNRSESQRHPCFHPPAHPHIPAPPQMSTSRLLRFQRQGTLLCSSSNSSDAETGS